MQAATTTILEKQQQGKDKDCTTLDTVTTTTTTTACKATNDADQQIQMNEQQKLNNAAEQEQQQQQQQHLCVQLDELPDEIIEFILTYLPPYKDLEHCRLVCKRWEHIVKNLIRRSKLNLHKGLLDFRLRWEVHTPYTTIDPSTLPIPHFANNSCGAPLPIIAGRFSHSAVRHHNSMYVFGGGSSSDTTFNDLWRFDLSEMRWERPLSMGTYPSPKGSATMVCWQDQLILFGGWRYPSLHPPYQPWCLFDELHYYDVASQRWTVQVAPSAPPPMAGHSASVHGDTMVVFGGYQIAEGVNSNSNETWCFDLRDYKWWQPRIVGNVKPPPRYGQFQLALDDGHLLIVGGCGGPNSVYSDAWLLEMDAAGWTWRTIPVRNKKYGASHMWYNPACKVGSKLVVLGPTPNMPQDFQMMRQMRMPVGGGMPGPRMGVVRGGVIAQHQQQRRLDAQRPMGGGMAGDLNGDGQFRVLPARLGNYRVAGGGGGGGGGGAAAAALRAGPPDDQYYANRRAVLNQHLQQAHNNFVNNNNNGNNQNHSSHHTANVNSLHNNNNNNNNLQPRTGRLSDLHASAATSAEEHNSNRPTTSTAAAVATARINGAARIDNEQQSSFVLAANGIAQTSSSGSSAGVVSSGSGIIANGSAAHNKDVEAANRLQRNLALRCRENEPLLPKRFDELFEDPFRMAAFNVQGRLRNLSKDHNERIRRMEEKMNAIRNSRRNAAAAVEPKCIKEPSPKRVKRNVLSLFVCDLSAALAADDPHLQWVEYKNYGIIPGAPERLILSTMVAGHGELILFGGVHKETLNEITHQVSNSIHFLSAPRDIV